MPLDAPTDGRKRIFAQSRYHRRMPSDPIATPVGAALREAKQRLRARIMEARDALPAPTRRSDSVAIAQRIAALPSYAAAPLVLLTLPFRSEWDTVPLVENARAAGKIVVMPRVDHGRRMLELCVVDDAGGDVEPGYRGIPEPRRHCSIVAPGIIGWALVPGVAFDRHGRRLGYGGGYYDRLLPLLAPDAIRIAGAFEMQLVDEVPAAPHDLTVDAVVTPRRVVEPR
jgi:5-formyltetrahydrofolate cyclo-ligase